MEPIILTYFNYNKETESWPESKAALSIEKERFHSRLVYPSALSTSTLQRSRPFSPQSTVTKNYNVGPVDMKSSLSLVIIKAQTMQPDFCLLPAVNLYICFFPFASVSSCVKAMNSRINS